MCNGESQDPIRVMLETCYFNKVKFYNARKLRAIPRPLQYMGNIYAIAFAPVIEVDLTDPAKLIATKTTRESRKHLLSQHIITLYCLSLFSHFSAHLII